MRRKPVADLTGQYTLVISRLRTMIRQVANMVIRCWMACVIKAVDQVIQKRIQAGFNVFIK